MKMFLELQEFLIAQNTPVSKLVGLIYLPLEVDFLTEMSQKWLLSLAKRNNIDAIHILSEQFNRADLPQHNPALVELLLNKAARTTHPDSMIRLAKFYLNHPAITTEGKENRMLGTMWLRKFHLQGEAATDHCITIFHALLNCLQEEIDNHKDFMAAKAVFMRFSPQQQRQFCIINYIYTVTIINNPGELAACFEKWPDELSQLLLEDYSCGVRLTRHFKTLETQTPELFNQYFKGRDFKEFETV